MNINRTLLDKTYSDNPPSADYLLQYNVERSDIEDFLLTKRSFKNRQTKAFEIIEGIFSHHGKEVLLQHLTELARVEKGAMVIQPRLRDHVVHALLSFVLGIYVNERLLGGAVNKFVWKLAGLLHDVAYPIEISHDVMASIPCTMSKTAGRLGVPAPHLVATTRIDGLEDLMNGVNSLRLIQDRVSSWGLHVDVSGVYKQMQAGRPRHGMYGALAVLRVLDMMYQMHNPERAHKKVLTVMPDLDWNQQYFDQEIVSACTSIFLHDLPPECFNGVKISRQRAPVAFLLRLCDALQDWERPSKQAQRGRPATKYDIEILPSGLTFRMQTNDAHRKKLRNEIQSVLDAPDILIV